MTITAVHEQILALDRSSPNPITEQHAVTTPTHTKMSTTRRRGSHTNAVCRKRETERRPVRRWAARMAIACTASDVEEDGVGAIRGALLAEPTEYVGQRGARPPA